ncbi:MAG: M28 family peptidase [bacterium]|nr:M28 family peptidase [bacterium]
MKLVQQVFLVVLLVVQISSAWANDRMLVSIEQPTPDMIKQMLADDILVTRDLGRYLVAVTTAEQYRQLSNSGMTIDVLDSSTDGKNYYTVSLRNQEQASWLRDNARLLRQDSVDAVIEATASEADAVSSAGLDIAKVFMRPIRLAPETKPQFQERDDPNPIITNIVNSVSGSMVDSYVQRLQDFQTRYASHDSCQSAADWLVSKFESFGIESVYTQNFSSTYKDNVIAEIPGMSEPDKVIVIGGHYDSTSSNHNFCPGADDNASGTSCVIECARVLAGLQFEYTIKFVAFCGEEQGLYGSEAFASAAAAAGENIVGAIAVDMIGYKAPGDFSDLDIIDNSSSVWMRNLVAGIAQMYVPQLPVVSGSLPFGASSDHASFWANGYDAILFFEDTGNYSPYIHSSDDTVGLSYNNPQLAENSVKIAAALVATMAQPFTITIAHDPLVDTQNTSNPLQVLASVFAAETLVPGSLQLHYDVGSGYNDVVLSPTGTANQYEAYIPAQNAGAFVDYYLSASDNLGNIALHPSGAPDQSHHFFVGTKTPFLTHEFETDQGWTIGANGDDATSGIWEQVNPNGTWEAGQPVQPEDDHTVDPGAICFVTGNAPPGSTQGTNDVDGGLTTLLSPVFDLSEYEHVWVKYHRWYVNNTGNSPGQDHWVVEVTSDGGFSWEIIEDTSASEAAWVAVELNLEDLLPLTEQVQFRFMASDEDDGSIVEAGVDDFSLLTFENSLSAADEIQSAIGTVVLHQNTPNPFNPATTINFSVPEEGQSVSLKIYDLTGRLVRVLIDQNMVSGAQSIVWRGRDDGGRDVSTGIYFYQLQTQDSILTRKLVLIR